MDFCVDGPLFWMFMSTRQVNMNAMSYKNFWIVVLVPAIVISLGHCHMRQYAK
jgi:hypothetical protein